MLQWFIRFHRILQNSTECIFMRKTSIAIFVCLWNTQFVISEWIGGYIKLFLWIIFCCHMVKVSLCGLHEDLFAIIVNKIGCKSSSFFIFCQILVESCQYWQWSTTKTKQNQFSSKKVNCSSVKSLVVSYTGVEPKRTKSAGETHGLRVVLDTQIDEYLRTNVQAGFKVQNSINKLS